MGEKILKIKYRCQHPSCQIKICREGEITIEESKFQELLSAYEEDDIFKSPKGICRLGFSQPFKIVQEEEELAEEEVESPIEILKKEHKEVLKLLETMEDQIRKRDIEGLWVTSARVEDEIMLHSVEKEEGVLFPIIKKVAPFIEGHLMIMHEDHQELMAFLHSFREGLQEDDILDGVAYSVISNLRSHIRKEDNEFFDEVDRLLDKDMKKKLLEGMKIMEERHVHIEPGDRHAIDEEEAKRRREFKETLMAAKKEAEEDHCH